MIYIWRWSFNPISVATKVFEFSKCLTLKIYIHQRLFILSLWRRKYSSFQNASPFGFIFGRSHLMLSTFCTKEFEFLRSLSFNTISFASNYSSIQNASLRIYIRQWSFNPISVAAKVFEFSKCLTLRIYIHQRLFILSLWRQKYSCFQNASPSGFIFDRNHSMLSIFTQKYSSF